MVTNIVFRRRAWAIAVGVVLATLLATLAIVAAPEDKAQATIGPEGDGLGFGIPCKYTKSGDFDPIKYPGDFPPSPSHVHDFFGVLPFNADSTNTSIRNNHTSQCDFTGDRVGKDFSAYWVPQSLDANALTSKAYYKPVPVTDTSPPGGNRPYPSNLKIISGENVWWDCNGNFNRENSGPSTRTPHTCDGTNPYIMADVRFPDCLKAVSGLASGETHVGVYSPTSTGVCPSGYTKFLQLHLHVIYDTGNAARLQRFSSGGPDSYHADFMNGWDVDEFNRLITQCVEDGTGCGQDGE